MRYPSPLRPAVFLHRRNRFVAEIELDGRRTTAVVPTTGRLTELLFPGADLRVAEAGSPQRIHRFDVVQARHGRTWVKIVAIAANRLFAEAHAAGLWPELAGWDLARPEVAVGHSRFDWLLTRGDDKLFVEVKSVTLVEGGVGLFPDAPTERGARHLRELAELVARGHHAAVALIVQRSDAREVRANMRTDPDFGAALREAATAGVVPLAARCRVTRHGIAPTDALPLRAF